MAALCRQYMMSKVEDFYAQSTHEISMACNHACNSLVSVMRGVKMLLSTSVLQMTMVDYHCCQILCKGRSAKVHSLKIQINSTTYSKYRGTR
jgi:hypothetical protein